MGRSCSYSFPSITWIMVSTMALMWWSDAEILDGTGKKIHDVASVHGLHRNTALNTSIIRSINSDEIKDRKSAKVSHGHRYQPEDVLWRPLPEVGANKYDASVQYRHDDAFPNDSNRTKRGFLDEQKKVLLAHLPIPKKEDDSDILHWEKVLEEKNAAMAEYNYPDGINKLKHKLQVIGRFLIMHKYFEIDRRYEGENDFMADPMHLKPQYMVHFPLPRLRKLHTDVRTACDKGFQECIDEIFAISILTPSAEARHKNSRLEKSGLEWTVLYPFRKRVWQFNYRTTASYYMCWYTMMKTKELEHFSSNCFDFSYEYEALGKTWPRDLRSNDEKQFACALLSFCPDICCGNGHKGRVASPEDCWKSESNPCGHVADGYCKMPMDINASFQDLIRNRINYTCNCEDYVPGFEWNIEFQLCVDKDECYDDMYTCKESEVCQNTVGSYMCICRRGFKWNTTAVKCERHYAAKDFVMEVAAIETDTLEERLQGGSSINILQDIRLLIQLFSSDSGRPRLLPVRIVFLIVLSRLLV